MNSLIRNLVLLAAFPLPLLAATVESLRCEHLQDPLGLDVARPRLSWQIRAKERGVRQTASRILVASSADKLARDEGDVWDSGRVAGDASVLVEYAGRPLASRAECFWKVRAWTARDGDGVSAGAPTPWSRPARWSMGLLKPEDWSAQWIGSPTTNWVEAAPMLRREFEVAKEVRRATAYVTGPGYFELSLNGKKVGDHELDPKNTRFDKRVLYVTHDVTDRVRRGRNALGAVLGNGWFNYHNKNAWDFDTAPWRAKPALLLQLEIEYADGTGQTVASDATWKYATGPVVFDALLAGETYDARLEKPGWDRAGYDDASWAAAKVVAAPRGALTAQMIPPIRAIRTIKPVKLTEPKPGLFVFDFGQNLAGTFRLRVRGPAGTDVSIETAELLHKDGTLNPSNINTFSRSYPFQTYHYVLKGSGTETWRPRFMYDGFQYAQVSGFPGRPALDSLEAVVLHTDLPPAGSFRCANELVNQIQHCTWWSFVNNFHGHPTDCPNREKNGWTGDAHLAAETGLYNFDAAANYTQWLRDFRDEQRPDGVLPGIIPTGGWGYQWGNGPAWDSALVLIPWYVWQYRGDRRILEENYENMKRYVDYLTTRASNGIVKIGLGDWAPANTKTPEAITSTGYYACDARIVSRIAALLGRSDDEARYAALFESVRRSFNREFFDAQKQRYGRGEQTALACAIYQQLVEPEHAAGVVSNLVKDIESKAYHLDCGILGTKYLMHALTDHGRGDIAWELATQPTSPSWGGMVMNGATTLWEQWTGGKGGTRNHIMFGDISAWCYAAIAGIRPDPAAPGFKRIVIRPETPAGLKSADAWHESPHGRIISSWKRDRAGFTLSVAIPANTTATIHVPAGDASRVTEGGRPAAASPGVKSLGAKDGRAVFEVGSGRYSFAAN